MKHFDCLHVFVDQVVDEDRAMQQLSDFSAFSDHGAHAREAGEQVNMIEQGIAEEGCGFAVVLGNVADDFGEIVQRFLRVEETVVHLGSNSRTFSAGTTRPASASRMPSSMAARVSSFSSSRMGAGLSRSNLRAFAITLS